MAEVLITLTIVGIIAALTIPNLMAKYQEHAWRTQFKDTYSVLNQAYAQMVREHGGELPYFSWSDLNNWEHANLLAENLSQYMKVQKKCNATDQFSFGHCIGGVDYYTPQNSRFYDYLGNIISGGPFGNSFHNYAMIRLETGAHIYILSSYNQAQVAIDVNGFKGPNSLAKDVWAIQFNPTKIVPYGYNYGGWSVYQEQKPCTKTSSVRCAMDILKDINYIIPD